MFQHRAALSALLQARLWWSDVDGDSDDDDDDDDDGDEAVSYTHLTLPTKA